MRDETEVKNAIIKSTMLGYGDHGILTCKIHLDYGGSGQSFGGYAFDSYCETKKGRVATKYGMEFISGILHAVGVRSWEDLKGTHVRVKATYSKVLAIGDIIKDNWFDPQELL